MTEKKKTEGRPSKKVRDAVEKHEAPKIEMTKPPAGREEKKKLAILDEKKQIYFIYEGMRDGKSIEAIAEELAITPATVRTYIAQAVDTLNQEVMNIKMNWAQVWLARTEAVVSRLMSRAKEGIIDKDYVDMMDKLQKMQERILGTGGSTPQGTAPAGTNIFINTVESGTELYNQGLANMQLEYAGRTVPELEQYVGKNEDTRKLSGLLSDD